MELAVRGEVVERDHHSAVSEVAELIFGRCSGPPTRINSSTAVQYVDRKAWEEGASRDTCYGQERPLRNWR